MQNFGKEAAGTALATTHSPLRAQPALDAVLAEAVHADRDRMRVAQDPCNGRAD